MTLLVRDESDILDAHLRYHLEHGVDFVVATDHASRDGSTEILESYAREGCLHLIRESGDVYLQPDWVTTMARLAATDFGADWVINSDADEFWWPRDGSMSDVLAAIPERFGLICGLWRHFVPRPEAGEPFWERMVVRGRSTSFAAPYWPPWIKVVHRANSAVEVSWGNHDARGPGLALLRGWLPFEIFHFPVRSLEQMTRKWGLSLLWSPHTRAMTEELRRSGAEHLFGERVVDDDALARGLADGFLSLDTRLRDVLRVGSGGNAPAHRGPELEDDIALAEEFDAIQDIDSAVRLARRVDALEHRLEAVEATGTVASSRITARAGAALRGWSKARGDRAS